MNKYEKLIEHIINDDEQAARKLFHQIVVEKSRDIYESLMDEELGGNPTEKMVDEITDEVEMDEEGLAEDDLDNDLGEPDDEVDFDMDDAEHGDLPADDHANDDEDLEDRVMDLESELEQLKAEFDKLMSDEHEEHGDDEFDSEEEFDADDSEEDSEEDLDESAKEEEDDEEEEEEGEEMQESRANLSQADLMREYVEKVKEFYKGEAGEGDEVGSGGKKVSVNARSLDHHKNDMGGSAKNLANGGAEQSPDGKQFKTPSNEYSKKKGDLPHAGKFKNVPGADAKQEATGMSYEKAHSKEGKTVGANGSVPVNTKSEIGGKVR